MFWILRIFPFCFGASCSTPLETLMQYERSVLCLSFNMNIKKNILRLFILFAQEQTFWMRLGLITVMILNVVRYLHTCVTISLLGCWCCSTVNLPETHVQLWWRELPRTSTRHMLPCHSWQRAVCLYLPTDTVGGTRFLRAERPVEPDLKLAALHSGRPRRAVPLTWP